MRILQTYTYTGSWIDNMNVSEAITGTEEKTSEAGIIPIVIGLENSYHYSKTTEMLNTKKSVSQI